MRPTPARLLSICTLSLCLCAVLACAGTEPSEGAGNEDACRRYVDHMNGLDCVQLTYDADETCAGAGLSPADMVPYWDCARANARCEGETPVIEIAQCRQPMM